MSTTITHQAIAQALAEVTESLRCYTVQVHGRRVGSGSGVLWRSLSSTSSVVITNAHVLRGSAALVELFDGRTLEARVIACDPQRDLAALNVKADNLAIAPVGNSEQLRVGELVLAVGNPWGVVGALTTGIVHTACLADEWIQADVRLAPGNSGGPLANAQGQVVGINSMIVNGLAIAISSNTVERFLNAEISSPLTPL